MPTIEDVLDAGYRVEMFSGIGDSEDGYSAMFVEDVDGESLQASLDYGGGTASDALEGLAHETKSQGWGILLD